MEKGKSCIWSSNRETQTSTKPGTNRRQKFNYLSVYLRFAVFIFLKTNQNNIHLQDKVLYGIDSHLFICTFSLYTYYSKCLFTSPVAHLALRTLSILYLPLEASVLQSDTKNNGFIFLSVLSKLHLSESILYLSFPFWLILLSLLPTSSFVLSDIIFSYSWVWLHCVYKPEFLHSLNCCWAFGCFHILIL